MFKKISDVVNYIKFRIFIEVHYLKFKISMKFNNNTVTAVYDTDGDRDKFHRVIVPRYPICGNLPVLKKTYNKYHNIGLETSYLFMLKSIEEIHWQGPEFKK